MEDSFHFGTLAGTGDMGEAVFSKATSLPRFYTRTMPDLPKSRETGAPQFMAVDYIELLTPGERDTVDREVQPHDKRRWRDAWEAYKEGREHIPTGTPITHLFLSNPEIAEHLRALGFHTVEQLAEASDAALQSIPMGAYDWQNKAKKFMEGRGDASKFAKLEKEQEDLRFQNSQLQEQLKEVLKRLAAKKADNDEDDERPARRGRAA